MELLILLMNLFHFLQLKHLNSNMELLICYRVDRVKIPNTVFKFQYGATNIRSTKQGLTL